MITLLRLTSLLLGGALIVVPPYALLLFAHGLGEPHATHAFSTFLPPTLMIGLALGSGPLLVGLPGLATGARNPKARIVAGMLLAVSIAGFLAIGFDGYLTRVLTPAVLLVEAVLFAFFVWPARHFSASQARSPSPWDERHGGQ
ncbi:hypothetical protein E0E50_00575 [Azotobacter chroococcum subsp. isscasi]|uniref:hypothetical protein n=1 Tax=Azotobacter chroococcum TaxID=353 RepID=UPI00103EA1B9|nr:hypothetical protein [Azotobacter chroococcum]TBW13251.1 hypothetical protein E0E50_00575 [Azotobacter chroococcum subsp. isscasi]